MIVKQFLERKKFSRDPQQFDKYSLGRIGSQNSLRRRSLISESILPGEKLPCILMQKKIKTCSKLVSKIQNEY